MIADLTGLPNGGRGVGGYGRRLLGRGVGGGRDKVEGSGPMLPNPTGVARSRHWPVARFGSVIDSGAVPPTPPRGFVGISTSVGISRVLPESDGTRTLAC